MATTSDNLAAGTAASGGRGGDGRDTGRRGLRARVAVGVATLGCVAALALGGLQARDAARPHQAVENGTGTASLTGETPCPLGGTAPCGISGGAVAPQVLPLVHQRGGPADEYAVPPQPVPPASVRTGPADEYLRDEGRALGMDCPLATAGPCFGQWTTPPADGTDDPK